MRIVRIYQAAAEEAVEAAAWYELQRPGLGKEFDAAIQAALDLLEEEVVPLTPMPGGAGLRGAKRLLLKRFPYEIVVIDQLGDTLVLAVAHHSRRPGYWRDRQRT
jgi:hypothetical protein